MLRMFAPNDSNPPSLNSTACTISTRLIARHPAHGPSITAASTPPNKCPDTGRPSKGKLTICAAKTIAAIMPVNGTARSSRSTRKRRSEYAIATALTAAAATQTSGPKIPSRMCIVSRCLVKNGH